ncbi:MAG: nucleotidyltransferase family protein [Armatimonadota bacterium]
MEVVNLPELCQNGTSEQEIDISPVARKWFVRAIQALKQAGVPFLMGGAFGLYHYTGFWRGTKDLDILVLPQDREAAIEALTGAGFSDMFQQEPYDREWIFRGTREGVIVDLIWRLANKADDIAEDWFERSCEGEFFGERVRHVSAADMCWMKLFVFQRKRCDWPDIINVIRGTRGELDWGHLLHEVRQHWRLLCALVEIFDWLCPQERHFIPKKFRYALEERRSANLDEEEECRRDLFDTRPWLTHPGAGNAVADSDSSVH